MSTGMLKSAAVLGLLSAVGPFAIDMYLPALPTVATDLNGSIAAAQLTLTAYFIAFGIAQLVYGPLADQVGRKPPLYIGLAIFIAASIGCAFASNIETLTAFRFLQGLGAAVTMVIPRAIIRDLHTGTEATRLMALIMMVISVSPMLAPLAGSGVIHVSTWRTIFVILSIAAIASLFLTGFMLPETLKRENRVPVNVGNLLRGAKTLLTDRKFMGLTFIGGFGLASFFVFLASASFVYTGQFGLTPVGFSLAFAVNAIGFFAASQLAASFGERFGMARTVFGAVIGFCTSLACCCSSQRLASAPCTSWWVCCFLPMRVWASSYQQPWLWRWMTTEKSPGWHHLWAGHCRCWPVASWCFWPGRFSMALSCRWWSQSHCAVYLRLSCRGWF